MNSKNSPEFSVIITSFNDGEFLQDAISSVERSTFKHYEIIIVDDCSTDKATISVLDNLSRKGYRVITKEKNKGVGDSRNIGVEAATGKYILTLDADDRIRETYLEKAFAGLQQGFDVVYCNVQYFGADDTLRVAPAFDLPMLLAGNFIASCSPFTREIWLKAGGYDTGMPNYEDWEFWVSVAENNGRFMHLNEALFEYRARASSKVSKCADPVHRAKMIKYVIQKHINFYNNHVVNIVPYLHQVIVSLENERATFRDFRNSIFWKLKRLKEKVLRN